MYLDTSSITINQMTVTNIDKTFMTGVSSTVKVSYFTISDFKNE